MAEKKYDSFCCRLCYCERFREMKMVGFVCCGCSVIFSDPEKFSLTPEQLEVRKKNLLEISKLIDEHTRYAY